MPNQLKPTKEKIPTRDSNGVFNRKTPMREGYEPNNNFDKDSLNGEKKSGRNGNGR